MKPRLQAWFIEYEKVHTHPTNRLTHKIAIPLIVFHILAMLTWIPLGPTLTVAHLAYVLLIGWYLSLDVLLGGLMALGLAICFPLAALVPHTVVIAVAVIGWTIQLAGHKIWEKKSPAFFRNIAHAFIGPLYFVAVLLHRWSPHARRA